MELALSILIPLASAIGVFFVTKYKSEQNAAAISRLQDRVDSDSPRIGILESKARRAETRLEKAEEKLEAHSIVSGEIRQILVGVSTDVDWIKKTLEKAYKENN